jgi:hypothetical protein
MTSRLPDDIADPVLFKLYWGFMLPDICRNKGLPQTDEVKKRLHEIHKKYLKYPTIAGQPHRVVSRFLFEVCALWACFGVFVRTREEQPIGIENRGFDEIILVNGEEKRVWDLL